MKCLRLLLKTPNWKLTAAGGGGLSWSAAVSEVLEAATWSRLRQMTTGLWRRTPPSHTQHRTDRLHTVRSPATEIVNGAEFRPSSVCRTWKYLYLPNFQQLLILPN